MKEDMMRQAIGGIDDKLIEDSDKQQNTGRIRVFAAKWGAVAACLCIVLAATAIVFLSRHFPVTCEHKLVMPKIEKSNANISAGKIIRLDWASYPTAEALVEKVSDVYTGTVTDISFDVIDMKTGKTACKDLAEAEYPMLCVIYTIETEDYYKGSQREVVQLKTEGAWSGFKEDEQLAVLASFENSENFYLYTEQFDRLTIGESYVFCTQILSGGPDYVYNPFQFAFQIDSANAKAVLACVK